MPQPLSTTWRITELPDWPNRIDVTLTMDTDALDVINAVEEAAAQHGIELVRVDDGRET